MTSSSPLPLVSIIIPCYNAERWVQEAVESCFNQSYPNIEIIAVDDGSTDRSLEILQRYSPRITIITGPNRGGNPARNTGFAHASGTYVQFLDADDYLEPDKIALQVDFIEQRRADAVYGDYRCRIHLRDAQFSYLGERIRCGDPDQDLLASLLSMGPMNGGTVLYRRSAVEHVGGWDESLGASQDRDFLISVALSGARICYQPSCGFIYRRYGALTVSTTNLPRWLKYMSLSLGKSEAALVASDRLTREYRLAIATGYYEMAKACYSMDARSSLAIYSEQLDGFITKIQTLSPHFAAKDESTPFMAAQSLLGFGPAMHLFLRLRAVLNSMRDLLKKTPLFYLVQRVRLRGVKVEQEGQKRSARENNANQNDRI